MYIWLLAYAGARGTSLDGFNVGSARLPKSICHTSVCSVCGISVDAFYPRRLVSKGTWGIVRCPELWELGGLMASGQESIRSIGNPSRI
jgi:hypothetical protein